MTIRIWSEWKIVDRKIKVYSLHIYKYLRFKFSFFKLLKVPMWWFKVHTLHKLDRQKADKSSLVMVKVHALHKIDSQKGDKSSRGV